MFIFLNDLIPEDSSTASPDISLSEEEEDAPVDVELLRSAKVCYLVFSSHLFSSSHYELLSSHCFHSFFCTELANLKMRIKCETWCNKEVY